MCKTPPQECCPTTGTAGNNKIRIFSLSTLPQRIFARFPVFILLQQPFAPLGSGSHPVSMGLLKKSLSKVASA